MNKPYKFFGFNAENEYYMTTIDVYSTSKLNPLNKGKNDEINTGFFHFANMMYIKRDIFL